MSLFSFKKKQASGKILLPSIYCPYKSESTNLIYNLLFCDNLDLYKANTQTQNIYPYNILFSHSSSNDDLQKIVDDNTTDPRIKILACNKLILSGKKPFKKELLAVIVEVGLNNGLDVLASFVNGTARYINYTGKILIWETTDETSEILTRGLFDKSLHIINQIGSWDKPRKPYPQKNNTRITFLLSDGIYFGEAPSDVLFNDQMAKPALMASTYLMQYIIEKSVNANK